MCIEQYFQTKGDNSKSMSDCDLSRHDRPSYYDKVIGAATCDFQQCDLLTSVDLNEPVQPILSLETPNDIQCCSLTLVEYSSDKQRL